MVTKSEIGKKARASGMRFEKNVREDLEKDWIIAKWTNNVDLENNKHISAKHKFNPFNKIMSIGTGFPDFICYKQHEGWDTYANGFYEMQGVECKSNGYLDKIEKQKCQWLLENNIFSKIIIAKKGNRGVIIYEEFKGGKNANN